MENIVILAGMASAVAGSFALSLLLGWLSLRGVLLLMPVKSQSKVQAATKQGANSGWVPDARAGFNGQRAA